LFHRKARRFLALGGPRQRQWIVAWLSLPLIDLMLRVLGLDSTQRLLARAAPVRAAAAATAPNAEILFAAEERAAVIALAGRYALLNGTCLRQALLLWWQLRRHGLAPAICIGVSKQGGFRAHAWAELGGRQLGQTLEHPARLVRLEQFTLHQSVRAG
jgi:hypothetical protein